MGEVIRMNVVDYTFTRKGAEMLKRRLREYWAKRGKDYRIWVEETSFGPGGITLYSIRSNIPSTL